MNEETDQGTMSGGAANMQNLPRSSIPGVNVLLMGAPGTGKTHAIRTLVEADLEVFILFTEPGMEVLGDTDPDQVHWNYVASATVGWDTMIKNAKSIQAFDNKTLQKMAGMNKMAYGQFIDVLSQCQNFHCQRTDTDFGGVDAFGTDKVFVFDSLSGLNIMALDLAVGGKPIRTLPDWGVAMENEERLINRLCLGTNCHFVLTAHLEREVDEVLGGIKLMASALGRKLSPQLPRFFSDVIMTVREADKFTWATASSQADTKARNLPWKDQQIPSFVPVINQWRKTQ